MADYGEKPKNEQESDEDIIEEARKYLSECIDEEEIERAKMRDDLRFCTLDQWPAEIRAEREGDIENGPRPCLTIDKINQYLVQVVNDVRQGKPGINVRPQDDAADVETAKVLKGLVRNIEDQSNADIAYACAVENAVRMGLGYFRIATEYVSEDSFDQEIFIRPIANTFSVYLSKHTMPDGSDAERGFIVESMPIATFRATFPKAKAEEKDFEGIDSTMAGHWKTGETITVVEEYCLKRTASVIHYLADGSTITDADYRAWPVDVAGVRPTIQDSRTSIKKQLKWRKMTAIEVLDKRDLPGQFIPIIEVVGREAWVDGRRCLWGLVRPAKDSLRMYNYWASSITERMGLAPKNPYVGAKGQFENLESQWKEANRKNRAYLEYNAIDVNGNAVAAPERQGPTPIEAALLQQMQVIEHDVQTSLGIFKAGIGESESQQSGRAILALQRESDTGTYHFGANLGVSIRQAGRVIMDMIPHYYDTKRIIRILGEDGEVQNVALDPEQQTASREIRSSDGAISRIYNPGIGKYDVSITVGPSYNTKRMEAAAVFTELSKGASEPISAAVMRYLTVRHSDFTGSDEAAKMLKALLPPAIQQVSSGQQQLPPEAAAKIAQMQQGAQMLGQKMQELTQENMQLKSGAQAKLAQTQADHDAEMKRLELERAVEAEKAALAREKAAAEFELEKWKAGQEIELEDVRIKAEASRAERKMSFDQAAQAQQQEFKRAEQAKDEEATAMPNFMKAFEGVLQIVREMAQSQQAFQQQIVQQMTNPPKRMITLGGIKRGEAGITGATATVN